jgi:quinol monooxygenase YgiN
MNTQFPTITVENPITTVVDIMTVDPDQQTELINKIRPTLETMRQQPGFISSSLLRSLDGLRVALYNQWASESAFDTAVPMLEHLKQTYTHLVLAGIPRPYKIRYVGHIDPTDVTRLRPGVGITAFNEVTTTPEKQEELLEYMIGVDGNAQAQAGYVSSNIHTSTDGVRNLNLVQFQSQEVIIEGLQKVIREVMARNADASIDGVAGLGTTDLHLFEVLAVTDTHGTLESQASQTTAVEVTNGPQIAQNEIRAAFERFGTRLTPSVRDGIDAVFSFNVTGRNAEAYTVDARAEIGRGLLQGQPEEHHLKPMVTISMSDTHLIQLMQGQLLAPIAVMTGKLRVKGNPAKLTKLAPLFSDHPSIAKQK